jgi:hypothetical protein
MVILSEDASITAGARIAFASPIGIYFDFFHKSNSGLRGGVIPDIDRLWRSISVGIVTCSKFAI